MNDKEISACLAFAGHIPEEHITADTLRRFAGAVKARTIIECAYICDAQHFGGKHDDDLSWTGCAVYLSNEIRELGMPNKISGT